MSVTQNIQSNAPLQIRKVSQLPNYSSYYKYYEDQASLSYTNSYLMVGYPSNTNIHHNYKITLEDLNNIAYTYVSPKLWEVVNAHITYVTDEIYKHFNQKFDMLLSYMMDSMGDQPNISYYWNIVGPYIRQHWGKDYVEPDDYLTIINGSNNNQLSKPLSTTIPTHKPTITPTPTSSIMVIPSVT